MNEVTNRIDELRKKKGLTKKALITKMGVPPSTFNNWFYDDVIPTFANIETVCRALDITVEQFFHGIGTVENNSEQEFLDAWRMLTDSEKSAIEKVIAVFKEDKAVHHD